MTRLFRTFPCEQLEFKKCADHSLKYTRYLEGVEQEQKTISLDSYWWNYTDMMENYGKRGRPQNHPNHPKNKGTGNLDSSGEPTMISVYIKFVDEAGAPILLYQDLDNWASTPPWTYSLGKPNDFSVRYDCNGIRKLVHWLN